MLVASLTRTTKGRLGRPAPRVLVVAAALVGAIGLIGPPVPANAVPPSLVPTEFVNIPNAIVMATRPSTGVGYIGTRDGRVYMLRPGLAPLLALDMRSYTRVSGELGLLGLTFHPTLNYAYVSHTSLGGNSRLAEYSIRADGTLRRYSRRLVLTKTQPYSNHKGGDIAFGPDGYLYMGFGDGGSVGDPKRYALKMNTWLGKIIRINPRPTRTRSYQIPADNPFVNTPGAKKEIWSIGLRNPWQFSFDSATGDLWIGDVGQGSKEEVDLARAVDGRGKGVSFGWSAWEGTERYNEDQPAAGHQAPLYEYGHDPACSITGGLIYHGSAIPSLQGAYLFADFCSGVVSALTLDGNDVPTVTQVASVSNPVSFGVDATGEVYVLSLSGTVFRLDPPG